MFSVASSSVSIHRPRLVRVLTLNVACELASRWDKNYDKRKRRIGTNSLMESLTTIYYLICKLISVEKSEMTS